MSEHPGVSNAPHGTRTGTLHGTPSLESTIEGVRGRVAAARASGRRIALVPTMGALHEGHLTLVRRARELVDGPGTDRDDTGAPGLVVVSIFVNPLQFGPAEDFDRYPRTLEADLAALAGTADAVFAPAVAQMYPDGPTQTRITGGAASTLFEGASRPGHFDGMLTVVAKLLNIVQPEIALFGKKDAQQVFLVRQMVADLDLPVRIEAIPIVREGDGLALSSRNRYLDTDGRVAAVRLSRALAAATDAAPQGASVALGAARAVLSDAGGVAAPAPVRLDYLAIVDPRTFHPVDDAFHGPATVIVAARVGETRLIDNADVVLG